MSVKELYEWAKKYGYENAQIEVYDSFGEVKGFNENDIATPVYRINKTSISIEPD